jgi:phage-related minor tail protein
VATKPKKRTMSDDHKAALASGRTQGKAIGEYLDAVAANKPKRGRKRTADSVKRQLEDVESKLTSASGTARVELAQRRRDLEVELAGMNASPDLSKLEADFVQHAKEFATRKGVSYAAFREVGVPAEVLAKAGISR